MSAVKPIFTTIALAVFAFAAGRQCHYSGNAKTALTALIFLAGAALWISLWTSLGFGGKKK